MIINFYVLVLTPRYVDSVEKSGYEKSEKGVIKVLICFSHRNNVLS